MLPVVSITSETSSFSRGAGCANAFLASACSSSVLGNMPWSC
jgi:hypothetical protein